MDSIPTISYVFLGLLLTAALGSLLLLFAGGISVAFGYFLSNAITKALETLVQGAVKLSEGD